MTRSMSGIFPADYVTTNTYWTAAFKRVLIAYLAREICIKIAPNRYESVHETLGERIKALEQIDVSNEPRTRSSQTTVTLTDTWRQIYNDALLIMGLDEISSNTDDSNRRTKIDRAIDAGVVEECLERIGWYFASTSTQSDYDSGLEPSWGYNRVHAHPTGMKRLEGVWVDEYFQTPLKNYVDEGEYIYCSLDTIYIKYISTDYLSTVTSWPTYFRRYVAATLARNVAPSLKNEGANIDNAMSEYELRERRAMNVDVMQSPPRVSHAGNWRRARYRDINNGSP